MTKLKWDGAGDRVYETGVDHGVLYPTELGVYVAGVAWNGLVSVTKSPSGAEATTLYADNIPYLNLVSAEKFGASIEAFTYPAEFASCDGTASPVVGITVGQQRRTPFGLSYRSLVGDDLQATDAGYKIHLIYGALAAPTEKAYSTVNDTPEAITFSWEVTTTPVEVPGFKPSAEIVLDSTKLPADKMAELEDVIYGTVGQAARLPLPEEVFAIFESTTTVVKPVAPTAAGNVVTIPVVTGVVYTINNIVKAGAVTITEDVLVVAKPAVGYKFPPVTDVDWFFEHV